MDASVKCIIEEIARRFDNKIPGMKPSSSSLLKLNTGNSNNNNGNGSSDDVQLWCREVTRRL